MAARAGGLGDPADHEFSDFGWMWYADMMLALGAALVNLPIREAPVLRVQPQGAG